MRNEIASKDFDFEYTGCSYSETQIIQNGHQRLSGEALLSKIRNKLIFGDYLMGYKFATKLYADGTTEGINNVGTYDFGNWEIDLKNNRLETTWKNGWIDTVTNAYEIHNHIYFFDVDTGIWRTTFKSIECLNN